jgi:hypothetical protein
MGVIIDPATCGGSCSCRPGSSWALDLTVALPTRRLRPLTDSKTSSSDSTRLPIDIDLSGFGLGAFSDTPVASSIRNLGNPDLVFSLAVRSPFRHHTIPSERRIVGFLFNPRPPWPRFFTFCFFILFLTSKRILSLPFSLHLPHLL